MLLIRCNICKKIQGALAWRLRKLVGDSSVDRILVKAARGWRPFLNKPVFIGISGSAGKTTTKELLVRMLSRRGRVTGNPASLNALPEVAKTVLRARPTHDFCVAELNEGWPGALDASLALFKPNIGIVTVIGNDHWSAFNSREGIAEEVGKLIASLPLTGTAILNADDPLVLAMAANCAANVITYGASPHAELRAEDIKSCWPDRLQMTLIHGTERVALRTQLCGRHWTPSVLGAVGGGLAAGMTLSECAAEISNCPPFEGRMQALTTANGLTFIRDDWKAPLWTVDTCLEFMREAQASRKIVVIGTLSDCGARTSQKYIKVARKAQEVADITIFVGHWATQALKARKSGSEDALQVFRNVRDASEFLSAYTEPGDLIMLKGTNTQDHLLRLLLSHDGNIACWRDDCNRNSYCNECPDQHKPSGLPVLSDSVVAPDSMQDAPICDIYEINHDGQIIVGLGNPEPKYLNTPHNVGYEVVDHLAKTIGGTWEETPWAWIARGSVKGKDVHLLKVKTNMNLIGASLKKLADEMSFGPEQCVLVFDDLDMKLGSVRLRLAGGAGGHKGVASILEAFQSDRFRRVKVGVGNPAAKSNRVEYLLTPFEEAVRISICQAIAAAEDCLLEMVERQD